MLCSRGKKTSIPTKNRNKDSFALENVDRGPEIFLLTALCSLLRGIVGLLSVRSWQHYVKARISRMREMPGMIILRILNLMCTTLV